MSRLGSIILDVGPLRHDRDYRHLWLGQILAGFGRQVTIVALPYQLYVLTGSPLAIGGLALVQLVPLLVFSLIGGSVADAVDRRRLLLVVQTMMALTSGVLVALAVSGDPPVWALYLVAFASASFSAFDQPARSSAVPRLVPRERLAAAIALNYAAFTGASIAGPLVGGILIGVASLPVTYAVETLMFAGSLVMLLTIAPIPPLREAARPSVAAVAEGLRFALARPILLSTFAIDLVAMIFGMPQALFPVLALDVFGAGAAGVGALAAAPAIGAFVAGLLTGWVGRVRYQGRAVIVAVVVWGLAITGFGLATFSFPLALIFLAVAGGADMISAIFRSTILQENTPDELRGRLSALNLMVVIGGPRLGDIESTAVAAAFGPVASVVSGGLLCRAGVVAVARRFPQLSAYDAAAVRAGAVPSALGASSVH